MKNLLITTAMVLLILTMTGYWFKLDYTVRTKEKLKYTADEAAASAALLIEEDSFGEGILQFDRSKAGKRADEIIVLNLPDAEEKGRWEVAFMEEDEERPAVCVTIYYENLKAESIYEYVPLRQ